MKAKEMFEKLGYECNIVEVNLLTPKQNAIFYRKQNGENAYRIWFLLDNKTWCSSKLLGDVLEINNELHKAITQQMKELGWLDD